MSMDSSDRSFLRESFEDFDKTLDNIDDNTERSLNNLRDIAKSLEHIEELLETIVNRL